MNPPVARSRALLIVCLGFFNALTPFTIDLYLPSFDDIARDLNATVSQVSLSVATYFVGFAAGQILYGPLLDRYGRKPPLYAGLAIYLIATIGCMTAQSVEALWVFRFFAAIGGSAASVGTVTMVRDYFDPKDAPKVFSMLMLVLSVSPLFAPSIGGWIAAEFGWRATFATLLGLAIINVAIVAFVFPRTYEPDPSLALRVGPIAGRFAEVFSVPQFRIYALAGALSFSGLFVYVAGAPGIFISQFHVSKQTFGFIFAVLACGMIGGGQLNNWLLRRFDSATVFRACIGFQIAASATFLFALCVTDLGLVSTGAFFFIILGVNGVAYPNAATLALKPIERNIGSASSLLGFIQMGLGAGLVSLLGISGGSGAFPAAAVLSGSSVCAGLVLWIGSKRHGRLLTSS